jgi:sulfur relay (sulfurtransferase) complex TusBCD TusD component (DsrE family)
MKKLLLSLLALMLLAAPLAPAALADNDDPLFVNMTTSDPHRAKMAIAFTRKQQELKHPVTVFLNDKGVLVGAKSKAAEFKEHQDALAAIIKAGGVVIVCPMCMEHYGIKADDLIEGAQIGKPELTGGQLFKDDTKTLTW